MKSAAFHVKSTAFREKRRFSKDHLQGIVTLCFPCLFECVKFEIKLELWLQKKMYIWYKMIQK